MNTAKQNQNFPFHFCRPPAEEKEMQGKFLDFARDRRERTRRAHSLHYAIRAYDFGQSYHARGACDIICFEKAVKFCSGAAGET